MCGICGFVNKWDKEKSILSKVTVEDIKKFGMIPEFVGRMPIICTLEGLTEDALVKILKEPKNAIIRQYSSLLAMDEVKLTFEEDALRGGGKVPVADEHGRPVHVKAPYREGDAFLLQVAGDVFSIHFGGHHGNVRAEVRGETMNEANIMRLATGG